VVAGTTFSRAILLLNFSFSNRRQNRERLKFRAGPGRAAGFETLVSIVLDLACTMLGKSRWCRLFLQYVLAPFCLGSCRVGPFSLFVFDSRWMIKAGRLLIVIFFSLPSSSRAVGPFQRISPLLLANAGRAFVE